MIKQVTLKNGLVHTYSTTKHCIKQVKTGIQYEEAYDLPSAGHTYEEAEDYTYEYKQSQREKLEQQLDNLQQEDSTDE